MAEGRRTKRSTRRPRATGGSTDSTPAGAVRPDADEREEAAEAEVALEPDDAALAEAEAELEEQQPPRPARALVRAGPSALVSPTKDALAAYMAEVNRHPLLTREEEHSLAVRYRATGSVDAAYRLVASNLRLVVKLAHEYHRNPLSLLDLIQEGNIGLMQAVKKYDPERGVKLSSYAAWWIRAYILRYIMDNWRMVKLGTTEAQRKLFFKLRQEQERLISQGFEPTPRLLAERLHVSEQDVVEMDQRLGHDEVSIDAPLSDEGRQSRADLLTSPGAVPVDERLGNEELRKVFREKLTEFAKGLDGKERFIFEKRLIADEPMTLQEIGAHYGLSRERARQIEASLIERMRQHMRSQIPDFDLVASPKG